LPKGAPLTGIIGAAAWGLALAPASAWPPHKHVHLTGIAHEAILLIAIAPCALQEDLQPHDAMSSDEPQQPRPVQALALAALPT